MGTTDRSIAMVPTLYSSRVSTFDTRHGNDRSIERHGVDARNGFGNRFAPAIDPINLLQNRSRAKVRFTQEK